MIFSFNIEYIKTIKFYLQWRKILKTKKTKNWLFSKAKIYKKNMYFCDFSKILTILFFIKSKYIFKNKLILFWLVILLSLSYNASFQTDLMHRTKFVIIIIDGVVTRNTITVILNKNWDLSRWVNIAQLCDFDESLFHEFYFYSFNY